ncbi:ROK family protein [Mesorhizobium sp.]|uniref:ROK family protein n=1 Tax=Mesorhizobium sp. TaxID=1871066 RepID=UPI0025E82CC4|nr:ROK family protein [Mesorhizobium sp.]
MRDVFVGVDLGGTGSRFVARGPQGVIRTSVLKTAELGAGSRETRLERLVGTIHRLVPLGDTLAGIGIGATGPVDRGAGVIHNFDTLPKFSEIRLVAEVETRLKVPVIIENDAVVAAIGEHRLGAGEGASRMLMVTLGTGIGAAFLVNGEPFRGPNGMHPETGHIPIVSGIGRCYCGAEGCWEQVASRSALQAMLRQHLPSDVPAKEVIPLAAASVGRNPFIREAFDTYGSLVGRGLSILHTHYLPSVTVLGGSAAAYLHLFEEKLHRAIERTPAFAVASAIHVARLGDEAGAIGAALVAQDQFAKR